MKICVKCKYYHTEDNLNFCTKHSWKETDLVTGAEVTKGFRHCRDEREDGSPKNTNRCGKEGKHWEPREPGQAARDAFEKKLGYT